MNDLISKYDVLEICKEQIWNGADNYYPITANAIAEKVRQLPSAQRIGDRITLKTALETDPWMAVYCVEPDREISVEMRYKDLVAIRKLIVRYCEEQAERKEE